jgi:ketosteroid isomerase-like protein
MTEAVTAARGVYEAFAEADMAALAALLADIEWHENLGMPYGGVWRGFAEVAGQVFGPLAQDVPDFTAIPEEVLPLSHDRAIAFGTYRGHGGKVATPFCHVWTHTRGKLVKFQQYADSHLYRVQTGML